MKTKHLIAAGFIFVLIFLAGCAQTEMPEEAGQEVQETAQVEQSTTVPTGAEVTRAEEAPAIQEKSYSITDESMAKLEEKLASFPEIAVSEQSFKIKFGEVKVFAVGITNLGAVDNFLLEPEFRRSYDRMGNIIISNKSMIDTWTDMNIFTSTEIGRNEQKAFPFIVEIKNLVDGTRPKAGTYEFKLNALYQGGRSAPVKDYANKVISIQLEE